MDRAASGGCSNKCQFLVTSYRDLRYDVLNIGKQEVWMGYETLTQIMDTITGTEFVSANLINLNTKRPLAKPYLIKDYGNLRVGILGLVNEVDFPKGTTLLDTVNLAITPHLEAARKYVPMLARKTDAVIVLAELSNADVDTLLKCVPEIDLLMSTGTIRTGEKPALMGRTQVIGTGSSGSAGHYAMLEFNPAWPDSVGFSQYQEDLTDIYDEPGMWADRQTAFAALPSQPPKAADPKANVQPKPLQANPTETKVKATAAKKPTD